MKLSNKNLSMQIKELLLQQYASWPLLSRGYSGLKSIRTKTVRLNNFAVTVQYNPARMTSTVAKTDLESIKKRKCFLCRENLPEEQKGILYKEKFVILCNPYPIFHEHFTIPETGHTPQRIENSFEIMLSLAKDMGGEQAVLYNGPECGASAPDHLHFQAGNAGLLPIYNDYELLIKNYGSILYEDEGTTLYAVDDSLRRMFVIESEEKSPAVKLFQNIYPLLARFIPGNDEPMINILTFYNSERESWQVIIFFRRKHRPSLYFAEEEEKIIVSPAAVDYGGLFITPREADFNKIDKDDIINIFEETSLSRNDFHKLSESVKKI